MGKTIATMIGIGIALLPMSCAGKPAPALRPPICDAGGKAANLDFTLKDIDGKNVTLSAYKGNVILLDFWATWCPPCKKEIPGFVEMYHAYKSRGFVVLGVSMDDVLSDVKPFAAKYKMNYPVLIGYEREDLQKAFGPMLGLPTTFVIGRDSKICRRHTGFAERESFERSIKALL
jgi:cytochrome c biogenesis protein CcmG/thiol:disulfide interchange protein DsbE